MKVVYSFLFHTVSRGMSHLAGGYVSMNILCSPCSFILRTRAVTVTINLEEVGGERGGAKQEDSRHGESTLSH